MGITANDQSDCANNKCSPICNKIYQPVCAAIVPSSGVVEKHNYGNECSYNYAKCSDPARGLLQITNLNLPNLINSVIRIDYYPITTIGSPCSDSNKCSFIYQKNGYCVIIFFFLEMSCSFACMDYSNPLCGLVTYPDGTDELREFANQCYLVREVCENPQNGSILFSYISR